MFAIEKFEDRLKAWTDFRKLLEDSASPLQDVVDFYDKCPKVSIATDPYDKKSWPDPWQLIEENQYCAMCKILGICYTLQLTERFKHNKFEIYISIDNENSSTHYLLCIDDNYIIGYEDGKLLTKKDMSKTIRKQYSVQMEHLH